MGFGPAGSFHFVFNRPDTRQSALSWVTDRGGPLTLLRSPHEGADHITQAALTWL